MTTAEAPGARRRSGGGGAPAVARGRSSSAIGLFCFSAILPLLFMAATAFRTQADWANSKIGLPTTLSLGAFERAWTGANIGVYFRNSRHRDDGDGRALRLQRDAGGLLLRQAAVAPLGRRLPVRARLDRRARRC